MRERDEKSQARENYFEVRAHLLYVPAFNTMKDFHYNDLVRSLGAATPTTRSLKNSWTRKSLTYSPTNNTRKHTSLPRPHLYTELPQKLVTNMNPQVRLLKYKINTWWSQYFDHLKTLSQQSSYRIDVTMESSRLCEKNKIELWWKTQEISLEKYSWKLSFWYGSIRPKTSGENL